MSKLEITAKTPGFRRAGVAWPDEPTVIDTSEKAWTKARVDMLKNEPELIVKEVVEVKETPAQKKAREAAEAKAKAEADEKAKADAEANAKADAEAAAKAGDK